MMKIIKKVTNGSVSRIVLETIKATGILSVALVAPNALQIFGKRGFINLHIRQRGVINTSRDRLIKSGFLNRDAKGFLRLTEKGEERLRKYRISDYELIVPKIWDKKWRVLIFDIPEERKGLRAKIRRTLFLVGFIRLQDSVWVFPYDCAELVSLLKAQFKVGKDLLYMVVNEIENDFQIKAHFGI